MVRRVRALVRKLVRRSPPGARSTLLQVRESISRAYLSLRRSKAISKAAGTNSGIRVHRYADELLTPSAEQSRAFVTTFHSMLEDCGIELFLLPGPSRCGERFGTTAGFLEVLEATSGSFDLTYEGITALDGALPANSRSPAILKLLVHPIDSTTQEPFSPVAVLEFLPSSDGLVVADISNSRSPVASAVTFRNSTGKRPASPIDLSCVDAVITWVDGSDSEWREKFDHFRREELAQEQVDNSHDPESKGTPSLASDAVHMGRFTSSGELRFQLRALHKFLPWIRKIFIVTDGQVPKWYRPSAGSRVCFVPHSEIMEQEHLPTFNSHAIEASLRHLDGLASNFVYFNDDMIPLKPTPPETFFSPDGRPMVFPSRAMVAPQLMDWSGWGDRDLGKLLPTLIGADWGAINSADILSRYFGPVMPSKFRHVPYASNLSLVAEALDSAEEEIQRTIASRFRSRSDVATLSNLVPAWGLQTEAAVIGEDLTSSYLSGASPSLSYRLASLLRGSPPHILCVTDLEHDEKDVFSLFAEALVPIPEPSETYEVASPKSGLNR